MCLQETVVALINMPHAKEFLHRAHNCPLSSLNSLLHGWYLFSHAVHFSVHCFLARHTFAAPVERVEAAWVGQAAISPLPAWWTVPVSRMCVPARGSRVRGERPLLMAWTGRQSQNAAHVGTTLPARHNETKERFSMTL